MEFYRRILNRILSKDSVNIDDIIINPRATTVLYIMKQFNLLDTTIIRCGCINISEKILIQMIKINRPTNNELYDLILYLDYINELDNYMNIDDKIIPKYDEFYDDINEKIGLKIKQHPKKMNTDNKICPVCHLIPYYKFEDKCQYCHENNDV